MRIVCALLLMALLAQAQQVTRSGIDMMPDIERDQRRAMYAAFYGPMGQINKLRPQLAKVTAQIRKQPKHRKLREQQQGLQKKIAAQFRAMDEKMLGAGLHPQQLDRLKRMPQGDLREERYNHGVVLEAPELAGAQRAVLGPLVASVDAAQLALLTQRQHLGRTLKDADKTLKQQFQAGFRTQHQNIEKRFWKTVYYVLMPGQMVAVRKLLSPRYGNVSDPQQQISYLPGLTASQATRVRALFVEHQSELTADQAEVRLIRVRIRDKSMPREKRQAMQKRNGAAYERMQDLNLGLRAAIREVLTPAQLAELRSITPQLAPFERSRHPNTLLKEMGLRPAQQQAIARMNREIERARKATRQKLNEDSKEMMAGGFGPESPQMMTMENLRRGAQAENIVRLRGLGHKALVEVVTPKQVVRWVIAPEAAKK